MESLVNLDGAEKVLNNLIDKLAAGVSWVATRKTPNKIAVETYINEIKEKDLDPLTKAALISNTRKIIREYNNQNKIVNIAIQSLKDTAKPEAIENDWLSRFMDKARLVSSEEFQLIWGKILARECNEPGSIPMALLYTLEKMDREDAESFTALRRITVQLDGEFAPVIIGDRINEYEKMIGITFDKLVSLSSLGLIQMSFALSTSAYALTIKNTPSKIKYYDKDYDIGEKKQIDVGNVIFTKSGQALCKVIDAEIVNGFWETYCIPFWEEYKKNNA